MEEDSTLLAHTVYRPADHSLDGDGNKTEPQPVPNTLFLPMAIAVRLARR